MPGVFIRDKIVNLRLMELEYVPVTLHIFNQYKLVLIVLFIYSIWFAIIRFVVHK